MGCMWWAGDFNLQLQNSPWNSVEEVGRVQGARVQATLTDTTPSVLINDNDMILPRPCVD